MSIENRFIQNKELFFKEYYSYLSSSTLKNYKDSFDFGMSENLYKHDLFDFSKKELYDAIEKRVSKSKSPIYKLRTIHSNYVKWGRRYFNREPQYIESDLRNLYKELHVSDKVNFNKFKGILSRNDLDFIIDKKIKNEQDQAIIALLFEGVLGEEACDLLGLEISQINGRRRL